MKMITYMVSTCLIFAFAFVSFHHVSVTNVFAAENISTFTKESDEKVMGDIRNYLATDSSLSNTARGIVVSVKDGMVSLKGDVASEIERNRITLKAQQLAGSYKVDSQLQVRMN